MRVSTADICRMVLIRPERSCQRLRPRVSAVPALQQECATPHQYWRMSFTGEDNGGTEFSSAMVLSKNLRRSGGLLVSSADAR